MSNKEIKTFSRLTIRNNRAKAFCIFMFYVMISFIFTVISYLCCLIFDKLEIKEQLNLINPILCNSVIVLFFSLLLLMMFYCFSAVKISETAWYSGRISKRKNSKIRFIYWIIPKNSFKAFRLNLLLFFIKTLWSILFLLPSAAVMCAIIALAYSGGVELYLMYSLLGGLVTLTIIGLIFRYVTVQRYFLAPFLMSNNPKSEPIQAIRQSKNLLDGQIFELIKFKLSFFPWFFTLFLIIPNIYFIPYYKQSCSVIAKSFCL